MKQATTLFLVIPAALAVFWFWPSPPPTRPGPFVPATPVAIRDDLTRGAKSAATGMIVFSDFQCPFCARFALETQPEIERRYVSTGKLVLAFKHLPVPSLHPHAIQAAQVAECSARSGRFWDFHDALFASQADWSDGKFEPLIARLGLDPGQVLGCLANEAKPLVEADVIEARQMRVAATPTFLIGSVGVDGRVSVETVVSGFKSFAEFRSILEPLIDRAKSR